MKSKVNIVGAEALSSRLVYYHLAPGDFFVWATSNGHLNRKINENVYQRIPRTIFTKLDPSGEASRAVVRVDVTMNVSPSADQTPTTEKAGCQTSDQPCSD